MFFVDLCQWILFPLADETTSNGTITVLNSERLHSATGPLKVIHGYATPTGEPGKLVVHLETVPIGASCECFSSEA